MDKKTRYFDGKRCVSVAYGNSGELSADAEGLEINGLYSKVAGTREGVSVLYVMAHEQTRAEGLILEWNRASSQQVHLCC